MLTLEQLTKVYPAGPGEYAGGIRGADFALDPGTFFTMLGPSGCGKTTTLRCIAGLEEPDSGRITVGNTPLFDGDTGTSVPLHQRGIGMVFQSYAIWPHMTVAENVSFPLRVGGAHKMSRSQIAEAVEDALSAVGLDGYGARSATQLSGGQQQRVALARAIVHRPKLLLLDEPLSNLDATLREEMCAELKRLQSDLGITAVYVTHDQTEALAMSDQIAVIEKGRIVQFGSPQEIYYRPANEFVAAFIGHTNLLRGRLLGHDARQSGVVTSDGHKLICAPLDGPEVSGEVVVSVRPENMAILPASATPTAPNRLEGTITAMSFLGNLVHYTVAAGPLSLQVETRALSSLNTGDAVTVAFAPEDARVLGASS